MLSLSSIFCRSVKRLESSGWFLARLMSFSQRDSSYTATAVPAFGFYNTDE